jgi:hypothetical protein
VMDSAVTDLIMQGSSGAPSAAFTFSGLDEVLGSHQPGA